MKKTITWIIVIAIVVIGGIWISGYSEASKLVNEGNASILMLSIKANGMNGLKKSGFMFYLEHNTDFDSRLKDLFSF
jgi:hypothetical protein